jgi:hypothetical protein
MGRVLDVVVSWNERSGGGSEEGRYGGGVGRPFQFEFAYDVIVRFFFLVRIVFLSKSSLS